MKILHKLTKMSSAALRLLSLTHVRRSKFAARGKEVLRNKPLPTTNKQIAQGISYLIIKNKNWVRKLMNSEKKEKQTNFLRFVISSSVLSQSRKWLAAVVVVGISSGLVAADRLSKGLQSYAVLSEVLKSYAVLSEG